MINNSTVDALRRSDRAQHARRVHHFLASDLNPDFHRRRTWFVSAIASGVLPRPQRISHEDEVVYDDEEDDTESETTYEMEQLAGSLSIGSTSMSPGSNEIIYSEQQHPNELLSGLNESRLRSEFCDVTLLVDGMKFPAHKVVLAAFSPYFKAMFLSPLAESKQNTVTIQGVEAEMVGLLLDYAYTSSIVINRNNVQALLSAANLLEVLTIVEACCKFLQNHMDSANCLGIHCFAEIHSCSELQNISKSYILQNFSEIFLNEEFLNLTCSKLTEFISDDNLQVDNEEMVFEALIRWYNHSPQQRQEEFPELLSSVRLALLSPYYLVDCVESMSIVHENPPSLKLVDEAKLYHLLPDRRHELPGSRSKPRLSSDTVEVIVAVGGEDDKVVLRAVECYCPDSKTWKALACVPFAISKHGLVESGKKKLYLAGGEFPDGGPSNCVWRYDPILDIWQEVETMLLSRSELGLAMLDGFMYAVGGWEGSTRVSSVERYNPSTNCWSLVAPMKMALSSVAAVGFEGMLYVTGGVTFDDRGGVENVLRYDPRKNEWIDLAPMKVPRSGSAICCLDSYIYVVGGWHTPTEKTNRVERYNVKKDSWELRAPMCKKRYRPGIAVLDNKIYVLGGEEGWDKYHDTIEVYDPVADKWSMCGKMLTPRSWLGCVSLQVRKSMCRDN